jgi:hypothetical protein
LYIASTLNALFAAFWARLERTTSSKPWVNTGARRTGKRIDRVTRRGF